MSWTKKLQNIALVLTSVLIALLLAELITRSFFPQNLNGTWVIEHNSGLALNKTTGTSRAQFGERVVSYHFGEYHNRKTEKQDSLQKGMPKLLVLGDSFTFGILLPDGTTYADRLQDHFLHEYEIINYDFDPSISKTVSGNFKASSNVIDRYLVFFADPDSTCFNPSDSDTKSNSLEYKLTCSLKRLRLVMILRTS